MLSLHVVPFGAVGFVHAPVVGLQVPAVWHASVALQLRGVPMVQTPARQMSPVVHALPSSQAVLSALVCAHWNCVAALQKSVVQGL